MAAFTMFLSALGICLFKPLSRRFHKVLTAQLSKICDFCKIIEDLNDILSFIKY